MSAQLIGDEVFERGSDPMFLTKDELANLTGRRRRGSQAYALRAMGIEHRIRPDGQVLVLRRHVQRIFGEDMHRKSSEQLTPDWSSA
ncbi:DUF4224 domain-containing protein [Paraburkholderia atlantica]|uniref:DUF4224 domain-containing protein n=1 Tax=Paraburkholderia TaxID=1822464 RepID=UPI003D21D975